MRTENSLEDLDKTIRSLGEIYLGWVQAHFRAGEEWIRATLEVRYASDGSYWDDKMRVEKIDHKILSLKTTQSIREILTALKTMRLVLGWYSMKMQIESSGEVKVNYGYDPNSVDDPSFFED